MQLISADNFYRIYFADHPITDLESICNWVANKQLVGTVIAGQFYVDNDAFLQWYEDAKKNLRIIPKRFIDEGFYTPTEIRKKMNVSRQYVWQLLNQKNLDFLYITNTYLKAYRGRDLNVLFASVNPPKCKSDSRYV